MPILQATGSLGVAPTPPSPPILIGTEYVLADLVGGVAGVPTNAVYQLLVDVSNMQAIDATALRIYTKVLSGSGLNSVVYQLLTGAPTGFGDQVMISVPVVSDIEIKFTLQQTAGAGRIYYWKVVSF